jgi:hypothetical protein
MVASHYFSYGLSWPQKQKRPPEVRGGRYKGQTKAETKSLRQHRQECLCHATPELHNPGADLLVSPSFFR